MTNRRIIASLSAAAILAPLAVLAADLIPCDGVNTPCNFGSLATLVNNIINWFLGISVSVAAITCAVAGAKILFNPGNQSEIEAGKTMLWKTIQGMFIILLAWLVVHTVIAALVNPSTGALRFLGN